MNDAKIIIIYKTAIIIPDKIYKKNFCHGMKFFGTYTHSASQLELGRTVWHIYQELGMLIA